MPLRGISSTSLGSRSLSILEAINDLGLDASRSAIVRNVVKRNPDLNFTKYMMFLQALLKNGYVKLDGSRYMLTRKRKYELRANIEKTKSQKIDVGTTVGNRYELKALLGKGTYGSVWKAKDTQLDRTVAIKFLHRGLQDFGQLKTEAKTLSSLTHKNILIVHDLDSDKENGWLVTEYIDGPSLEVYLKNKAKEGKWISIEEARNVLEQCLEGLEFAHDKNRVHGDIKPRNIFVLGTGEIKLGDFGVAKILSSDQGQNEGYPAGYDRRLGSPSCAAPEVLNGNPRDFQSDLFSVGVLAYILLTGQHPFLHKSGLLSISELTKWEQYSPTKLRDLNPEIPEKYERIVMRLLERDKIKRYQKAREVLDEWREKPEIVQCPKCNADNSVLNKFCGQCGNDLRATQEVDSEPEKDFATSFALFTAGRTQDAIEITKRSLETNPRFAKGWTHLGYMLNNERRYEEAEEACTKSIAIDGNPSNPYMTRGFARSNLGKYNDAIDDFTLAFNKEIDEKKKSKILYHRGYSKMLAGRLSDALDDSLEATELDWTNTKAQRLKEKLENLMRDIK
jgi:serine/threonine protein kinase